MFCDNYEHCGLILNSLDSLNNVFTEEEGRSIYANESYFDADIVEKFKLTEPKVFEILMELKLPIFLYGQYAAYLSGFTKTYDPVYFYGYVIDPNHNEMLTTLTVKDCAVDKYIYYFRCKNVGRLMKILYYTSNPINRNVVTSSGMCMHLNVKNSLRKIKEGDFFHKHPPPCKLSTIALLRIHEEKYMK